VTPGDVASSIDAIAKIGALGLTLLAIWGFLSGRVRVGSLVDKDEAKRDLREAEIKKERDDWKTVAQGGTPELKRLNDLLETAVKLLLDPRRTEEEVDRIVRTVQDRFSDK
jgi:hypothetical protein